MIRKDSLKRVRLAYYVALGRLEVWWRFNVMNFCYFTGLAWHFLRGRLLIITTENRETKGGYKCIAIVISKRPLSEENDYP